MFVLSIRVSRPSKSVQFENDLPFMLIAYERHQIRILGRNSPEDSG
jgi:hypothetical protein